MRLHSLARAPAVVLAFALAGMPASAHADSLGPDTLSIQVVPMERTAHRFLLDALLEQGRDPEALYDRVSEAAGHALAGVEASCRTNLLPRYSEPGSPWLGWRLLARVRRDSCDWFIGALSCADTLCGRLVTHDRLALMSITPARARILIAPGAPSTIGDEGTTQIDSVALFKGSSHILVQSRRRFDSLHPCSDGPDRRASEAADFFVLRGDRLLQALTLDVALKTSNQDARSADRQTSISGRLMASATMIQLDRRTVEWEPGAAGEPKKQPRIREARVRLRFDDGAGLYLGADSER